MRNIRRTIRIVLFLFLALWLHYVLPQRDTVRITGISDRIETLSGVQRLFYAQVDSGAQEGAIRDLRLVNTQKQRTWLLGLVHRGGERTMVYRNEDTGWIYPPYFKFDSSNLEAEAEDLVSTQDEPRWALVTHYGWRIRWLSIYPNAVSIRPAPGPDYRPFPWVNLIIYAVFILGFLFLRAMWRQFRERTLDPLADKAGDRLDHVNANVAERRGRLRRWLDSWRSR